MDSQVADSEQSNFLEELIWLSQRLAFLFPTARRVARREVLDMLRSPSLSMEREAGRDRVDALVDIMGLDPVVWVSDPSALVLPGIAVLPDASIHLIHGVSSDDEGWLTESYQGRTHQKDFFKGTCFFSLVSARKEEKDSSAIAMFKDALKAYKSIFVQVALATLVGNLLALSSSLYSMQVYDRVIPTQGLETLLVLTVGAFLACVLELSLKWARSSILDNTLKKMDLELSKKIFSRLLRIRLDQFPSSVGTLSAQIRSYESIRVFASSALLYVALDMPFALVFLLVIVLLIGPVVAAVPAFFFVLSFCIGMFYRKRIQQHAKTSTAASNKKLGLLVETIEGAEFLKATGSGWALFNRWNLLNNISVIEDMQIREYSEHASHFAAFIQQVSYISLVCTGAYIATSGSLTMGALIACSILSGRVFAPVGTLPGLLVQWGHARVALENLERVFVLQDDNHGIAQPLSPSLLKGGFNVTDLRFAYRGRTDTIAINALSIAPGEKVGILGLVGAGKSTLLKLLAGMYMPSQGRVLLDGLDMQHIARSCLSDNIGYLPQDVRLFGGTLRDNLVFGLGGVGDEELLQVCEATGLISLIASHAKGLDLEIAEGGAGVSGGQKQLIALTRLLLTKPKVVLLDEPTSAMDEGTESKALSVLRDFISADQTLVLATHKPALISLVNRLIIIGPSGVLLDGPRDAILQRLSSRNQNQGAASV